MAGEGGRGRREGKGEGVKAKEMKARVPDGEGGVRGGVKRKPGDAVGAAERRGRVGRSWAPSGGRHEQSWSSAS